MRGAKLVSVYLSYNTSSFLLIDYCCYYWRPSVLMVMTSEFQFRSSILYANGGIKTFVICCEIINMIKISSSSPTCIRGASDERFSKSVRS